MPEVRVERGDHVEVVVLGAGTLSEAAAGVIDSVRPDTLEEQKRVIEVLTSFWYQVAALPHHLFDTSFQPF